MAHRIAMFHDAGAMNLVLGLRSQMKDPWQFTALSNKKGYEVTGRIHLVMDGTFCKKSADCLITIPRNWINLMPFVTSTADWITPSGDWHINPGGTLCYELAARWRDRLSFTANSEGIGAAGQQAADWLINSVGVLLGRHYFARASGITRWPPEWDAWAHGEKGEKQYKTQNGTR